MNIEALYILAYLDNLESRIKKLENFLYGKNDNFIYQKDKE
jgi:hypothetical protein